MALYGEFLNFEHLYDARIWTEDGLQFPVHRVLLSMKSTYFRNLLCKSSEQSRDVTVPGILGPTMKVILDYIYTGQIHLEESYIRDVIVAAYCLGVETLVPRSRTLAVRSLSVTNCVPLFLAACKIQQLGISKASYRFIVVNFQDIVRNQSSVFGDLPVESLEQFLSLDELNVANENQVWAAIVVWVGKIPLARKVYLEKLIRHVRFSEQDNKLMSEIIGHPLVKENQGCVRLLENITLPEISKSRSPKIFFLVTKLFMNRSDYAEGIKIFITYDGCIDIWRNVGSRIFTPDIVLHGFGSKFVMFETADNLIYLFDVVSKTWSDLTPPVIPRRGYKVVQLGQFIYVLGGISTGNDDGEEIVTTAERYNFDSERWEFIQPHFELYEAEAAAVDSNIYIIGTTAGYFSDLMAAQEYNPETDTWLSIGSPQIYRRQFALVAYKSQLFILGGHGTEGCVMSVEVYDLRDNSWRCFADLPFPYYLPKGTIINDVMYVYDNNSDDMGDNYRCPPVFLDEANEKWEVVEASSPFCDLHVYQFCSVEDPEVILEMQLENRDAQTKWGKSPFFTYINTRDHILG